MNKQILNFLRNFYITPFLAFLFFISAACDFDDDVSKNLFTSPAKLLGKWTGGVGLTTASKIVDFTLDLPGESDKKCSLEIKIGEQYVAGASFKIDGFAHYYPGTFTPQKSNVDLIVLNCIVDKPDSVTKISTIFDMIKTISSMDIKTASDKAVATSTSQNKNVLTPQSVVTKFIESAIEEKVRVAKICHFLNVSKSNSAPKFFFSLPIRIHKLAIVNKNGQQIQKAELILQPILFTPLNNSGSSDQTSALRSKILADLIKDASTNNDSYEIFQSLDKHSFLASVKNEQHKSKHSMWEELGWYAVTPHSKTVSSSDQIKQKEQYFEGIRTANNFWLYLGIAKSKNKLMMIEVQKRK